MNHQDWRTVDVGRKSGGALTREELALKQRVAQRNGQTQSYQKQFIKSNSSTNGPDNSRKLDDATESKKIETLNCGAELQKGLVLKKMKMKDLAQKVNKKQQDISIFFNNKALATPQNKKLFNLLKRNLGLV